jgi:hypothetical protein
LPIADAFGNGPPRMLEDWATRRSALAQKPFSSFARRAVRLATAVRGRAWPLRIESRGRDLPMTYRGPHGSAAPPM